MKRKPAVRHGLNIWWISLLLALTACARAGANSPATFQLNEPFTLTYGQTAEIPEAGLTVTFSSVLEDSRCPTQVTCVWAGQARPVLSVQVGDGPPLELEFLLSPGAKIAPQNAGNFQIAVESLDPYPQEAGQAIPEGEYRLTLRVFSEP